MRSHHLKDAAAQVRCGCRPGHTTRSFSRTFSVEDAAYVRDCGSGNHLAPAKLPRKQRRRAGQQGKQWQGPGSSLQVCCLILPKRNPSQTRKLKLEVIVPCPRSDSGNMPCTYVPGRVDGYTSTGGHEARCSCQKCHSPRGTSKGSRETPEGFLLPHKPVCPETTHSSNSQAG